MVEEHHAPLALAFVTSPSVALACTCGGSRFEVLSPTGPGERPPNTLVRLSSPIDEGGTLMLLEDGVARDDVVDELLIHGETSLITLSTMEPLTPGAHVEVLKDQDPDPVVSFDVGTEMDDTPPTWGGDFTVDSTRHTSLAIFPGGCGSFRSHVFEWMGMADDVWPTGELLVIGEPDVEFGEVFASMGTTASVGEGACSHDDSTLMGNFHRTYDVFVEDGSGNRIGPFEVDTRAGCGCASTAPAAAGVWGVLVALAAVRRRRVRRRMHLAAGVVALLTCPTAASACVCIGSGLVEIIPASDSVDLPPNTHVRLEYRRDEPGPHVLLEDGIPRDDVIEETETHGESVLVTLSTEDGFTPGGLVEVFILEQEDPVVRFTVGTEPDDTPPSWDGEFTVNSHRGHPLLRSTDCEPARGHFFEWIGLHDDVWPVDELLAVGVADVDGGPVSFVDVGSYGSVYEGGCSLDDSTLLTDFHRVYDVFVEDGSGNRIGPFEVDTRAGCGCASSTPAGASGAWCGLVALAAVRRRGHVR